MSAMRKRSTARGRRKPGGHGGSPKAVAAAPDAGKQTPDQTLPLAEQELGPERVAPAEDAHALPDQSGGDTDQRQDGRPEPGTAAAHDEPADDGPASVDTNQSESRQRESRQSDSEQDDAEQSEAEAAPVPAEKSAKHGQPRARARRPAREVARKTGRPSVPAWDEIMFGSRSGTDRSSS
jgi:hypothetical protein